MDAVVIGAPKPSISNRSTPYSCSPTGVTTPVTNRSNPPFSDIRFIQQLLGHEKLETTAIHTQVSIEQLKAVHGKTHPAETGKKA